MINILASFNCGIWGIWYESRNNTKRKSVVWRERSKRGGNGELNKIK